jgi:DNA-binding transcriptional LysR family regulator
MRSERDLNLTQLRFLLAVIQHGTYSQAALELDVSQSTISHAIQELERNLQGRLLERGRHGAKPTALGERVAAHARNALFSLTAIREEAALERAELTGLIRLASIRSYATLVLPAILREFRAAHPNVQFEMVDVESDPGGIEAGLILDRADVGILGQPESDGLMSFELLHDDYLMIMPDDGREPPRDWDSLDLSSIMVCDGECSRFLVKRLAQSGRSFRPIINTRDDSVILSMVAHGMGVAVMPAISTHPMPPGVRAFPLPEPLERVITVSVTPARYASPVVRAFVTALRSADHSNLEPMARAPKQAVPTGEMQKKRAEARDTN